ncbi:hypothetical protein VitviT2T_010101 [Vitis vinifera]|uniref:Serine hydroxymethyltransferase-like domain-containing protein n=1 Tax=Vitis vinifera TaxID=29760 RepID=A0ABY9C6S3_VITVI|nr:hypothetical protein VitviT2T_010101 [Vitis vinifera]
MGPPVDCPGRPPHLQLCDLCNITVNKNAVFGDNSALAPGGVRIGAPAMTSRSLVEKDFEQIAEFLHGHLSMATLAWPPLCHVSLPFKSLPCDFKIIIS